MPKPTNNTPEPYLENDFERMIPEYHKGGVIYAEHMVRYQTAVSLVKGKVVLDIASGSGYGTALLAQNASFVYGVDVSQEAVGYAKAKYGGKNIEYRQGDGESIPLEDSSVDVVVSFETIEHIKDYVKFMEEVRRVLKADGLLLLSTPNDKEFAEGNHFHLHEFEYDELKDLVKKSFSHMAPYFQGTWVCSLIGNEGLVSGEWEMPVSTSQAAPIGKDKVLYFFMLCANRPITEKITPRNAIGEHWSARTIQEAAQKNEVIIKGGQHENKVLLAEIERLRADRDRIHYELEGIKGSKAWRVASKLVAMRKRMKKQ